MNNLPYSDRYFNTDWQFEMLKRGKPMDMILVKCILQNRFPYFLRKIFFYICCWYTLELPHRGNSNVHLKHNYVHSINECF